MSFDSFEIEDVGIDGVPVLFVSHESVAMTEIQFFILYSGNGCVCPSCERKSLYVTSSFFVRYIPFLYKGEVLACDRDDIENAVLGFVKNYGREPTRAEKSCLVNNAVDYNWFVCIDCGFAEYV